MRPRIDSAGDRVETNAHVTAYFHTLCYHQGGRDKGSPSFPPSLPPSLLPGDHSCAPTVQHSLRPKELRQSSKEGEKWEEMAIPPPSLPKWKCQYGELETCGGHGGQTGRYGKKMTLVPERRKLHSKWGKSRGEGEGYEIWPK